MDKPEHKSTERPEEFLSRWSRRKQQAREQPLEPNPAAAATPPRQEQVPVLPPVDGLNMDSDFRGFLHPKVDESLRRTALKKLFNDPHFNVMDGLDTYIDDYSVSDPIPEAMLAQMRQARDILASAQERRETAALQEEAERRQLAAAGSEGDSAAESALPTATAEQDVPLEDAVPQPEHHDKGTRQA